MSNKLLLGEGLDVIRRGEIREYELNKLLEHTKANKGSKEVGKLVQDFESVYRTYVSGLEILNCVRHRTSPKVSSATSVDSDKQLNEFCSGKMRVYMERCKTILETISQVYIPIQQIAIPMEGYSAGSAILTGLENILLREKCATTDCTLELSRGTYVITLLNKDEYTFLPPEVKVALVTKPHDPSVTLLEALNVKANVPCGMGWRRVIGTTGGATLHVSITASGKRDAHLSLHVSSFHSDCPSIMSKLEEKEGEKAEGSSIMVSSLEKATRSTKKSLSPSKVQPVVVRPRGMNCQERYDLLMLATGDWESEAVEKVMLPAHCQKFLQTVYALPMPTNI